LTNLSKFLFNCYGHENIRATHSATLEFTKDDFVTLQGDCIVGINADFDYAALKKFLVGKEKLLVEIKVGEFVETVECSVNPDFCSEHEIVIRRSDFISERTLGVRCTKTSAELDRQVVVQEAGKKIEVTFKEIN